MIFLIAEHRIRGKLALAQKLLENTDILIFPLTI